MSNDHSPRAEVEQVFKVLTLKQRAFVLHYVDNGGNATQAAKAAGYKANDNHVAAEVGYENLIKPEIQQAIQALLDKARLTPATATLKLFEGLNATKVHVLRQHRRLVEREVVDFRARAAYLDMYYRITGAYKQPPPSSCAPWGPLIYLPAVKG